MSEEFTRRQLATALTAFGLPAGFLEAAALPDPNVMTYLLPKDQKWGGDPMAGANSILLWGDVNLPGPYGQLVKWQPHNMSRPHFHRGERYIYVISGTWWCGSGRKYDPDAAYPFPAGTYVRHIANQTHFDGAKDAECVLLMCGIGPAPAVDNELK